MSNLHITSMAEDAEGYIWFGTRHGLNRFDGAAFLSFYSSSSPGGLKDDYIYDIAADEDGSIWVGTKSGYYNYRNGAFLIDDPNTIYNPTLHVMCRDRDHLVTVGMDGAALFRKIHSGNSGRILEFQGIHVMDNSGSVSHAKVSPVGDLWMSISREGMSSLIVLDDGMHRLDSLGLNGTATVYDMDVNINGEVWVATDRGLFAYDAISRSEEPLPVPVANLVRGKKVVTIRKYGTVSVLLGIADEGLWVWDSHTKTLTRMHPEITLSSGVPVCMVDSRLNVWIVEPESLPKCLIAENHCTHVVTDDIMGDVLQMDVDREGFAHIRSSKGFFSYDPSSGQVIGQKRSSGPLSVQFLDSGGDLWLGQDGNHLERFRLTKGRMSLVRTYGFESGITFIGEDADGILWVFTANRRISSIDRESGEQIRNRFSFSDLYSLPVLDRKAGAIYVNTLGDSTLVCTSHGLVPNGITLNSISCCITSIRDGSLWYGTYNKGLFHYDSKTGSLTNFDESNMLSDPNIKSILQDRNGNIWFSTAKQVFRYDPETGYLQRYVDHGMSRNDIYENGCACMDADGNLYFGGSGGYTVIDVKDQSWVGGDEQTSPFWEEILVNGIPEEDFDAVNGLTLSHRQQSIQARFALLDFNEGSEMNYSYRLDGLESEWHWTDSHIITYTNLSPRKYLLRVRTRNARGEWDAQELTLSIHIRSAPWLSQPAKIVYFLVLAGLVYLVISLLARFRTQRERIQLNEQREDLQRQQLEFMTNISHELRTPLSLIYGPVKQLLQQEHLTDKGRASLNLMEKNTARLVDLSEKLLSSSTEQTKDQKLRVSPVCPQSFLRELSDSFRYSALEKGMDFSSVIPDRPTEVFLDQEKIEKILYNLLSNAFKYTPEHGKVVLSFSMEGGWAVFSVSDNGKGISPDKRKHLFERFNRLGAESTEVKGSGVGLHYARFLSETHKGRLSYAPNEGGGSVFTLRVPCTKEAYSPLELTSSGTIIRISPPSTGETENGKVKDVSLVLVEDNDDVRIYLKSILSEKYNIVTCSNGEEGLDKIRTIVPDLVISDVMMPGKDGFTLCREIKDDPLLCHIPIVLLTAKVDVESGVKGLEGGAEAYITKPFDPGYLMATVKTLLENRRRVQQKIANLTPTTMGIEEELSGAGLNEADKSFLEKIQKILSDHLSQQSYSVEDLASEACMSYSSLYAKIKALTGDSPLSYINTYRMNLAMEMLKSGKFTVTEVAYEVGASSSSSFARAFKKHFGIVPTDAIDKHFQ